ncbi:MAG: hypothetical protein AB9880_12190 [Christensenellales bacterium]
MKIKPQIAVLASILFVVAGILGSMALGWWQTESNKVPDRLAAASAPGEEAAYDPADIRGSYTLTEISRLFEIPLEELAKAFAIEEEEAAAFKVKELETLYKDPDKEVGTSSMRLFVAWYKGLPYELKEESFLPAPAAAILREKAALTAEQRDYLDLHTLAESP